MKTGAELITDERQRQIEKEGWTPEHDDEQKVALCVAGASYALDVAARLALTDWDSEFWSDSYQKIAREYWPWDAEWWKPTPQDNIRELVKAGALIAAEIDRLQRSSK